MAGLEKPAAFVSNQDTPFWEVPASMKASKQNLAGQVGKHEDGAHLSASVSAGEGDREVLLV